MVRSTTTVFFHVGVYISAYKYIFISVNNTFSTSLVGVLNRPSAKNCISIIPLRGCNNFRYSVNFTTLDKEGH